MGFASEFCTTHWSVVCLAGSAQSPAAETALEQLCSAYWMPVYAFIRRQGHSPHDAEDLTQEFFSELVHRRSLAELDRSRGKFRSFLIACLNHFLAKDWRERNALKRGGDKIFVPIDGVDPEDRYVGGLTSDSDAIALFDRQWALAVLDRSLSALHDEQEAAGKGRLFEELKHFLTLASAETGYEAAARRLQMTPGAVATAVHRLRYRYRELVRNTVAQTVAAPLELEEEMRHLLQVLSQGAQPP